MDRNDSKNLREPMGYRGERKAASEVQRVRYRPEIT